MYHIVVQKDEQFRRLQADDRWREHVEATERMEFDSILYASVFGERQLHGLKYHVVAHTGVVVN